MKNTKWLGWILTILLALIILAGVGFAGFRIGVAQGAKLSATDGSAFTFRQLRGFDDGMTRNGFGMHGFDHTRSFGRGFNRGGFNLFWPFFFLLRVAFFGGVIWLAYTLVKRSGWRLVRNESAPVQTVTQEAPSAEGDEKKE